MRRNRSSDPPPPLPPPPPPLLLAACLVARGAATAAAQPQLQYVSWGHWGDGAAAEAANATGGFSWYTRIMDWVQEPYPVQGLSLGMGATWIQRVSNDPNTSCA
eukprot:SAG31_NODE_6624_length_1946_cov_1.814293_1_plen_103_part_10